MEKRKPNLMICDCCGKKADMDDRYKPDELFHVCASRKIGIWRKYERKEEK